MINLTILEVFDLIALITLFFGTAIIFGFSLGNYIALKLKRKNERRNTKR